MHTNAMNAQVCTMPNFVPNQKTLSTGDILQRVKI